MLILSRGDVFDLVYEKARATGRGTEVKVDD